MRPFPRLFIVVIACGSLLSACETPERPVLPLDQTDELVVITVNSPDTYYENADGAYAGLEFDLASELARDLGIKVRFKLVPKLEDALLALEKRQGHFAAGFIMSDKLALGVRFGPVYQSIQPQVAYNTDYSRPRSVQQLAGSTIEIASGTPYAEQLNKARQRVPDLKWTDVDMTTDDLLARLAEGKIDYAVIGAPQMNLAKNFYPNLDAAFDLGWPTGRVWVFPLFTERTVLKTMDKFFGRIEQDGTLTRLLDRYYGHIERLEQADVSGILDKRRTLLPDLRDYFHQAEELTAIDWRLIAALAYQESHWNPLAVSFANVRGLMMLTETTADRMKVTDRLDVRQSILAGARYLLMLKDRLPVRIKEPDRTWMALAAYNQGFGHLEDARILAQRMGLNPDSWVDLKKTMPLLSLSKHFRTLKHGYARGGEAVVLAESVRTYYEILLKYERPYSWGFPPGDKVSPGVPLS
ncbi:membrane-bound lytic murein transglycosylase MltF [Nitrosovibrio tenuis]|uniref:Membrane-bound lytic murein transglycosylase F n=1 Tax=Nitrosovibrio tenuis TaxID=1233 RepID=A0A1H7RUJ7_9PROT|nr:membrane-bound lytic murein transglycosylase MltF [Nitrosovibrio tenuis]SEL63892.1 membrane-bound lytic murein transglycosylase F [Nitrosovibrio tenuis]